MLRLPCTIMNGGTLYGEALILHCQIQTLIVHRPKFLSEALRLLKGYWKHKILFFHPIFLSSSKAFFHMGFCVVQLHI